MTKQEQNDIIKRVWTEHLQRTDSIPEDLADRYSIWLRSIIQQAASMLTADGQSGGEQQQEPAPGGEQPAA